MKIEWEYIFIIYSHSLFLYVQMNDHLYHIYFKVNE